jgi:hypothetical protein
MNMDFVEQVRRKTDDELLSIYIDSDDYQEEYVQEVHEELKRRNVVLDKFEKEKQEKQQAKDESMMQGKPGDPIYIALAFLSAFLGGLIGIIAGYIYSQSKHKDNPRGDFFVYDEKTRTMGYIMMVIGAIMFIALMFNGIYS